MTEQLSIVSSNASRVIATPLELIALREAAGLSIQGAAGQLRLAPRQVEALEQGAWEKLPGNAFVKGALRLYGKLLHADLAPLIASVDQKVAQSEVQNDRSLEGKIPESSALGFAEGGKGSRWAWAFLIFLGIAAAALYFGQGVDGWVPKKPSLNLPSMSNESPKADAGVVPAPATRMPSANVPIAIEPPASSQSSPASSAESGTQGAITSTTSPMSSNSNASSASQSQPTAAATQEAPQAFYELSFAKDSWVEIKDASGERVLYGTQTAGTNQALKGKPPYIAVIGNAQFVKIAKKAGLDSQPVTMPKDLPQGIARLTLK